MLSDEENKAIEQLRSWREYIIKHKEDVNKANDIEFYLRTAINLIEKQSKEIEEYKKQLDLDYVDIHFVPVERYNQLEKEIEELKKFKKQVEEIESTNFIKYKNYISKDKIKAKIEYYEKIDNPVGKRVLESLLEKE